MQAASVGFATGATLGNFDEAMGATAAKLTRNPNNYARVRDSVRQLQNDLPQRHPYIYGGAEIVGATYANKLFPTYAMPVAAGIGYANSLENVPVNIVKNAIVSRATKGIQKIPYLPDFYRNFGQNWASWYLLDQENKQNKNF